METKADAERRLPPAFSATSTEWNEGRPLTFPVITSFVAWALITMSRLGRPDTGARYAVAELLLIPPPIVAHDQPWLCWR